MHLEDVPRPTLDEVPDGRGVLVKVLRVGVDADAFNQGFVLGNKVLVGTVNASRDDFVRGVDDLVRAEALHPGWLGRLLTNPVHGLENYAEMLRLLTEDKDA